jgi:hypothetical protein
MLETKFKPKESVGFRNEPPHKFRSVRTTAKTCALARPYSHKLRDFSNRGGSRNRLDERVLQRKRQSRIVHVR